MIRLAVSVEGHTELEFVQQVLAPFLGQRKITVTPVIVSSKRLISGEKVRGGSINGELVKNELRKLMPSFDYVTSLYDFYGFQGKGAQSPEQLEAAIAESVGGGGGRLISYVQVHEFEALLFSGPEQISAALRHDATAQLSSIVRQFKTPEAINDNPETCPSRRLLAIFQGYDKVLHGPTIAKAIGLKNLRARCPRFDGWIARLETLTT